MTKRNGLDIDSDIERVRGIVQDSWDHGAFVSWALASCVLLGFRIAKGLGAK